MDAPFLEKPHDIGEIILCETTQPKAAFKRHNTGAAIGFVIGLLLVGAMCWLILSGVDNYTWPIIGLVAGVVIAFCSIYYNMPGSFAGTDMFVGTEGFSYYKFRRDRANKTKMATYYYRNMLYCRSGRTKTYKNGSYEGTRAAFTFCFNGPGGMYTFAKEYTYRDERHYPPQNSGPDEARTRWLYMAEQQWNTFIVPRLMHEVFDLNRVVKFNNNRRVIEVWRDGMRVGDAQYLRGEVASIYPDNGALVIEHRNFEKGIFMNKGNRDRIDLSSVDNVGAFLTLLENIFGK